MLTPKPRQIVNYNGEQINNSLIFDDFSGKTKGTNFVCMPTIELPRNNNKLAEQIRNEVANFVFQKNTTMSANIRIVPKLSYFYDDDGKNKKISDTTVSLQINRQFMGPLNFLSYVKHYYRLGLIRDTFIHFNLAAVSSTDSSSSAAADDNLTFYIFESNVSDNFKTLVAGFTAHEHYKHEFRLKKGYNSVRFTCTDFKKDYFYFYFVASNNLNNVDKNCFLTIY